MSTPEILMPYAMVFRPNSTGLHFMTRVMGSGPAYYQGALPAGVSTIQLTWNGAGLITCQYRTAEMPSTVRIGQIEGASSELEINKMFRVITESEGAYVQFQYNNGIAADQTDARLGVTVIPMGEGLF